MVTDLKSTAREGSRASGCGRPSARQMLWAIVFGISLTVGTAVLRHLQLPAAVRYLIPAVPLLVGFFYMRAMVADIRRQMDELQLRIYLEAAAVVVCGLFLIALSYPMLQAANLAGPLDYLVVLVLIGLLGAIGYISAARRYR